MRNLITTTIDHDRDAANIATIDLALTIFAQEYLGCQGIRSFPNNPSNKKAHPI